MKAISSLRRVFLQQRQPAGTALQAAATNLSIHQHQRTDQVCRAFQSKAIKLLKETSLVPKNYESLVSPYCHKPLFAMNREEIRDKETRRIRKDGIFIPATIQGLDKKTANILILRDQLYHDYLEGRYVIRAPKLPYYSGPIYQIYSYEYNDNVVFNDLGRGIKLKLASVERVLAIQMQFDPLLDMPSSVIFKRLLHPIEEGYKPLSPVSTARYRYRVPIVVVHASKCPATKVGNPTRLVHGIDISVHPEMPKPPAGIILDIENLEFKRYVTAGELKLPEGVRLEMKPETSVFIVR